MPKKILCAVDGSDASDRAAACAVELAKETGAKLTFVHVSTVPQDHIARVDPEWRDQSVICGPEVRRLCSAINTLPYKPAIQRLPSLVIPK